MRKTKHFQQRMSQRGVNQAMVDLAVNCGVIDQDRYVLSRKSALALLDERQRELRVLKKIVDKGGVAVVTEGDSLITTYNVRKGACEAGE